MEHLYTAYSKIVQDKTYYFVKKIMQLPEIKGLADIVVGYGMHTDFNKACSIAGLDDMEKRKQLLSQLEEVKTAEKTPEQAAERTAEKAPIQVADSVIRWLAGQGAEVLN